MSLGPPARPGGRPWLPWLALALVPLFFAAGFGLVATLTGGEDDPDAAAGLAAPTEVAAAPSAAVDTAPPQAQTTTAPVSTTTEETQAPSTTAPTETEQGPLAEPGAIEIDYGRWEGMFALTGARLVPSLQASTVGGELTYLGGAGCPVRNVVVDGRFYDRDGVPVGLAHWESRWVTGGSRLERGTPVPFGAYGNVLHLATFAELEVVRVVCA